MACDESAHADGELVLRVEHGIETGRDWVISLYEDGRILTPSTTPFEYEGAWMIVRRLAPDGADILVDKVVDTGLFEASASYAPVPLPGVEPPGRGASGYTITVHRGDEYIEVRWTSMFGDDSLYYEPSPEREELDALGAELVALDQWLPDDVWSSMERCDYQAQRFRVTIQQPQTWGGDPDDLPVDVSEVSWPLGGDILAWGEPFSAGTDPDVDGRCGEATREEATALVEAIESAGVETTFGPDQLDVGRYVMFRLGLHETVQAVDVWVESLLPDELACVDPVVPFPFGI